MKDVLRGFKVVPLIVDDPNVVAVSGQSLHTMAVYTGNPSDLIHGSVFDVSMNEIRQADDYEVSAVARAEVILASGVLAWAYVDKTALPPDPSSRPR